MILLNVDTVETLVFSNPKLREALKDEFGGLFEQWLLTQTLPFLRSLRKRCVFDLLDKLNQHHVELLSDYLGGEVVVESVNTRVVQNLDTDKVEELSQMLSAYDGFPNFSMTRTEDKVRVTLWR